MFNELTWWSKEYKSAEKEGRKEGVKRRKSLTDRKIQIQIRNNRFIE